MRPVNLLPARYRPRTAGSGDSKSAYAAIGALVMVVLAVFVYVTTANQVSSRKSEIAQAQQQIAAAETRAVTFKDFGDFAAVKEARLSAVKSLATARVDWERLFRELAHVLPQGVWLTAFDGTSPTPAADSASGGGSTAAAQGLTINGCADSHRQIADVMVRLRELHVAEDVELTETSASKTEEAAGPAVPSATAPAAGGGGESGCGDKYEFEVAVTLASTPPTAEDVDRAVPARLGGGQ